eukprot:TRINITY_DN22670_c0_g1_i1.p1 TRINITY_DN22670_c0_g1~~TRINITY_DN22670_c0_g1_i1.p1  ORF type:complete len:650 (-),score=116.53 TRINITY_DN22670_c0_g1_i1:25-1953(-)
MAPQERVQAMSMKPRNTLSDLESEEKRIELQQGQMAKKIQRVARGAIIRNIIHTIHIFEDEVLKKPTPGPQAVVELTPPPIVRPRGGQQEEQASSSRRPSKESGRSVAGGAGRRQTSAVNLQQKRTTSKLAIPAQAGPAQGGPGQRPGSAGSRASARSKKSGASGSQGSMEVIQQLVTVDALADRLQTTGHFPPPPEPPPPEEDEYGYLIVPEEPPELPPSQAWLAARSIFRLLDVPDDGHLDESHLHCIYQHHLRRRRNSSSRTFLRLLLVQHGDSCRVPTEGASKEQPSSPLTRSGRDMLPAGWAQVTRTAWSLRLLPDWLPTAMLTSSLACSRQTSERLCSVLDDKDLSAELPGAASENRLTPCVWETLDYPDNQVKQGVRGLHFPVWDVAPQVQKVMSQAEAQDVSDQDLAQKALDDFELKFRDPKPVMLVAGGAVLESFLGFLCQGNSRKCLDSIRLGGGDAVLLKSPPVFRMVGDLGEERVRPDSELWQIVLKRPKWKIFRHVRGDGLGAKLGGLPPTLQEATEEAAAKITKGVKKDPAFDNLDMDPDDDDDAPPDRGDGADTRVFSETREAFRGFAGQPLIYSHLDFSKLVSRSGTAHALERADTAKLRPLVHHYKSKGDARRDRFASSSKKRSS